MTRGRNRDATDWFGVRSPDGTEIAVRVDDRGRRWW